MTKEQSEGWEDIESPDFKKFEEYGDKLEGELTDMDVSERYNVGLYTVRDVQGEEIRFHGSKQLDDLMRGTKVGDYIKVEYIDEQKMAEGRNSMKLFKVQKRSKK